MLGKKPNAKANAAGTGGGTAAKARRIRHGEMGMEQAARRRLLIHEILRLEDKINATRGIIENGDRNTKTELRTEVNVLEGQWMAARQRAEHEFGGTDNLHRVLSKLRAMRIAKAAEASRLRAVREAMEKIMAERLAEQSAVESTKQAEPARPPESTRPVAVGLAGVDIIEKHGNADIKRLQEIIKKLNVLKKEDWNRKKHPTPVGERKRLVEQIEALPKDKILGEFGRLKSMLLEELKSLRTEQAGEVKAQWGKLNEQLHDLQMFEARFRIISARPLKP